MPVKLVGVGVGPGDPQLLTLKAVEVLRAASVVFVPVLSLEEHGRAEQVVRSQVDGPSVRRVVFALSDRDGASPARRQAWQSAAAAVVEALGAHPLVAFATLGDPQVYSTFTYLSDAVRELLPGVQVETVPGITAMQDLASRSGTVLAEGTESLALLPLTAGLDTFTEALDRFDTLVAYKGGARMDRLAALLRERDRLDGAVYGSALGRPEQFIGAVSDAPPAAPYLSTVIVPARRTQRGGKL